MVPYGWIHFHSGPVRCGLITHLPFPIHTFSLVVVGLVALPPFPCKNKRTRSTTNVNAKQLQRQQQQLQQPQLHEERRYEVSPLAHSPVFLHSPACLMEPSLYQYTPQPWYLSPSHSPR
jgi:hypothetical protein